MDNILQDYLEVVVSLRRFLEQEMCEDSTKDLVHGRSEVFDSDHDSWESVEQEVRSCTKCGLWRERRRVVFGEGSRKARLMIVGEAPGAEEDRLGRPFVGPAGELLTRMLEAIEFKRGDVFIANVIKCRPPGNRDPSPGEIAQCKMYLIRQIALLRPKVILALGRFSSQFLSDRKDTISELRGQVFTYQGIKVVPTFHPAALLRNPSLKPLSWKDLKLVKGICEGKW